MMNWGKKLVICMAAFMVFILTMGGIMIIRNEDDALIEDDYYEKGQTFDKDFTARQDAVDDAVSPVITRDEQGLTFTFPVQVRYKLICRRLSDYHMDRTFNGQTGGNGRMRIMSDKLESGPWLFRIEYASAKKSYVFEDKITMP